MYLSVIIPFKNEERRLPDSLKAIFDYFNEQDFIFELILVDDGSIDSTIEKIKDFTCLPNTILLQHAVNCGKGSAIRSGMTVARGAYVLVCDADLSTPISEFDKLRDYMYRGFDIAIGSRAMLDSVILRRQSIIRRVITRLGGLLIRIVLGLRQRDTQCGFKLYRAEVIKKISPLLKMSGFSHDYEFLYLAQRFGYKIKEIGVVWSHSKPSTVKLFRDLPRSFMDVFRIYRNGKYLEK